MSNVTDSQHDLAERNRRALALLVALLELPDQRPGSWEAEHVEALEVEHLAPIFDVLTEADVQAAEVDA